LNLSALIRGMYEGGMTFDELERIVREWNFLPTSRPVLDRTDAIEGDPDGYGDYPMPHTFEEVHAAYGRGFLTDAQYQRLAQVASAGT
jgi:hypothetical protein